MKKVSKIIHGIKKKSFYKKWHLQDHYKDVLNLLPEDLLNAVLLMYEKNDTLFFIVKHPTYKTELHYKTNDIKNILKLLISFDKKYLHFEKIKKISIKTSYTHYKNETVAVQKQIFKSRAKGVFYNMATDKKIYEIFEEIRQNIIC